MNKRETSRSYTMATRWKTDLRSRSGCGRFDQLTYTYTTHAGTAVTQHQDTHRCIIYTHIKSRTLCIIIISYFCHTCTHSWWVMGSEAWMLQQCVAGKQCQGWTKTTDQKKKANHAISRSLLNGLKIKMHEHTTNHVYDIFTPISLKPEHPYQDTFSINVSHY